MNTQNKNTTMSAEEKQKARQEILQKYISDMMAVEDHIERAVKRQTEHEDVYKHNPQAAVIIQKIAQTTTQHSEHLSQHLEAMGGDPAKGLKEVATAALGTLAGIYDKVRTEAVSKMLRDDYTALNLAAVGYTMLHTTGLALQDQRTADLALRHLKHYTEVIMQINQIIPSVVVEDLSNDVPGLNPGIVQQAMQNTQDAWRPSSDGGSHQGFSNTQQSFGSQSQKSSSQTPNNLSSGSSRS